MRTEHYKHIANYVEVAKTKEQLAYALEQINAHRVSISHYGRQLYRNKRLNDLDEIESRIKSKMSIVEFGMTDMFTWAGVKVFVKDNEIIIKLE